MKMRKIEVNQIEGFRLGNAQDVEAGTGCTVIICEKGAVAGVDVRGGAPATRETDLIRSENTVDKINAVVLSGGSAFGLEAASGVMRFLSEKGIGVHVGEMAVPIVTGASLYDLAVGKPDVFPDVEMGKEACRNAYRSVFGNGNNGAGTGASVGKDLGMSRAMKAGLGTYAIGDNNLQVGAVTAVNALGDIVNGAGSVIAGMRSASGSYITGTISSMRDKIYEGIDGWEHQPIAKNRSAVKTEVSTSASDIAAAMMAAFENANKIPKEKPAVSEAAPEPIIEAGPEPAPEPKVETRPEPAPEPVPEPKVVARPEPVPESVPEPKVVTRPEPAPEPIVEAKPEPAPEPIVEARPEPKPEPAPEPVVEARPAQTPEPKVEARPEPAPETIVEAKPEPVPEPETPDITDESEFIRYTDIDDSYDRYVNPPLSSLPTVEIIPKDELLRKNTPDRIWVTRDSSTSDDDDDMGYDIPFNTVISCVITNAKLTKPQANKLASILHDAYARAIKPTHTTFDGDTIFVMATGKCEVNFDAFAALATDVLQYAIIDGAKSARSAYGLPAARDMHR